MISDARNVFIWNVLPTKWKWFQTFWRQVNALAFFQCHVIARVTTSCGRALVKMAASLTGMFWFWWSVEYAQQWHICGQHECQRTLKERSMERREFFASLVVRGAFYPGSRVLNVNSRRSQPNEHQFYCSLQTNALVKCIERGNSPGWKRF